MHQATGLLLHRSSEDHPSWTLAFDCLELMPSSCVVDLVIRCCASLVAGAFNEGHTVNILTFVDPSCNFHVPSPSIVTSIVVD